MYSSLSPHMLGITADAFQTIEMAGRHGFAGVDINLIQDDAAIEAAGPASFTASLAASGLRPGVVTLLPIRTAAADAEWDEAVTQLPRRASLAARLGYTRSTIVVLPFHETLNFSRNLEMHVRRLRSVAGILADHGIRLGLEYVAPKTRRENQPFVFIHDLAGLLEMLEAVRRPNLGLLLDCFHWHCAGETGENLRHLQAHQVVAVHVNDAVAGRPVDAQLATERELPGATGVIDLHTFMSALRGIRYDGPIIAEPMNKTLNALPPAEALAVTRQALKTAGV